MIVGIDRIEESIALCETDTGEQVKFSTALFIPQAKEGNWYKKKGDKFIFDQVLTQKKRDEITALLNSLFK